MKIEILCVVVMICFFSCKTEKEQKEESLKFYPFTKKLNANSNLRFFVDQAVLLERQDSISYIHSIDIKKDTLIWDTKGTELPSFIKDLKRKKDRFFLVNTRPRTLGKNRETTDIITIYDTEFREIDTIDLGVLKYPSGNSILIDINSNNYFYYVTAGFEFGENRKLVLSKLDDSLKIRDIKEYHIDGKNKKYDPLFAVSTPEKDIILVSDVSNFKEKNKLYRIDFFNKNLKRKWSKNFTADTICQLGYLKSENIMYVVLKEKNFQIRFWDNKGEKVIENYVFKQPIAISAKIEDKIFAFLTNPDSYSFELIEIQNKKINTKSVLISDDFQLVENSFITYVEDQLFHLQINSRRKEFKIDKMKY